MSEIIRYDNYCHISQEEDLKLFKELDKHLSYKILGAKYSKAYQNHYWDGIDHIMSSTGKFPVGLYDRVIDFYKQKNVVLTVVDKRSHPPLLNPIDISDKLASLKKNPRYYQIEAVETAFSKEIGVLKAATGCGKTVMIAMLVAKFGHKAIVYVIGKDLLHQTYNLFVSIFGSDLVGRIGDGFCDIKSINIATIWSIGNVLGAKQEKLEDEDSEKEIDVSKKTIIENLLKESIINILDECQYSSTSTVRLISKYIYSRYIFGLSASPWRDDGADMLIESFCGKIIFDLPARKLIEQKFLINPDIRFYKVPKYPKKKEQYQTVYSEYIVNNEYRNNLIIKGAKTLVAQGFKVLILFRTIKHGKILAGLLDGMRFGLLSGVDSYKKREKILQDIENDKLDIVVASTIFDAGIDCPPLSGLILANGGKASAKCLQRVGRCVRIDPNNPLKKTAIIDFIDDAPFLYDHSCKRRQILSTEFNVKWPA